MEERQREHAQDGEDAELDVDEGRQGITRTLDLAANPELHKPVQRGEAWY